MTVAVDREPLARPLLLPCGTTLRNRIAKAAMSEALADAGFGPSDALVRLYERWGRGGAGMLLSGNVIVDRDGRTDPANVVLEDDRHLAGLRRWGEAAQANGAALWLQLSHAGRQTARTITRTPVAPSAIAVRGRGGVFGTPRAMTSAEVDAMIDRFADAGALAAAAGLAGVQIHAAHGYLVSQFLSPLVNHRDDAWGGDATRRMAMLLAIVERTRSRVGPGFPIAVKLNSADFQRGGFEPGDAIAVAQALERAGVDLIEVSGGNYESPAMVGRGELPAPARESTRAREAYFLVYAKQLREHVRVPLMLTGGLRSAAAMVEILEGGEVDLLGLGRPLAVEPDLPARLLDGSADAARETKVNLGIRMLDDALQVLWYQQQIHRMGRGLEPDPSLGRVCALARGLGEQLRTRRASLGSERRTAALR
ncbi:MAG: NADH:flavin oxidoreductase/NADH oxidase family protein [Nannocystaceae bacterium]|nr:NADH:flavin oxidoreductase/NADH oxidase family protein [Nannocystaceae bacterium]